MPMTSINSEQQFFITSAGSSTIGIRVDQVLSFAFSERELTLSIRYIGDPQADKFEGSMAQAILQELRYAGRHLPA
jgi:hypothetical protein